MELPARARGDELLAPGALVQLRERLRRMAPRHDLKTVIAYAFDHRTRMLPFIFADKKMAPAGVRAIGSALVDSGFPKTRIVLQQWNRNFKPSLMRLDGEIPDLFLVSSMLIHTGGYEDLIRDACTIDAAQRPLVIAGGAKFIYEPWDAFSADPNDPWAADVTVTGEEYVLLEMLEVLLTERASGESLRNAFLRVRDRGLLDNIPGLVYARTDDSGRATELLDTGMQRLLGDLDELPHARLGYQLLEKPGRAQTLRPQALAPGKVGKYSPIASLALTFGCKFRCPYCPIPAYNQRKDRTKSPERIRDEMSALYYEYGHRYFFGTDDNYFNDHERTLAISDALASAMLDGKRLVRRIRWGTEATVHDTLQLKDHLRSIRSSGLRAVWMGVEDMTATFVKKGQSVDKTSEAFRALNAYGIHPMPMMMHHDGQPLYSPGKPYGLINQAQLLRNAGAVTFQVLMLSPATGSKLYQGTFNDGLVYKSANGRPVEPHMTDANYVIASSSKRPWRMQLNLMLAYLFFYNPLRFVKALIRPKSKLYLADALGQLMGMLGWTQTVRRTAGWMYDLWRGNIVRQTEPPTSKLPYRSIGGTLASHDLDPKVTGQQRLETIAAPPPAPTLQRPPD